MKTNSRIQIALTLAGVITLALACPSYGATMSASLTAPAVNGLDIANYGAVTGTDKWFYENSAAGAAKGQTFTTGGTAALLKAVSYQVTSSQQAAPTKTYAIRVGTVTGTTFTTIRSETATQNFAWNGGEYMTWTFATPVVLSPNTTYGVDVGMTGSTSAWTTGIPYINLTANGYAGGALYNSGTNGVGTSTVALSSTDRIFHLDLEHPMRPIPESGTSVPAGNVTLGWTNLAPTTGTDVWVDVWFGTNPAALTKIVTKGLNTTATTVIAPAAATYYWRVDSYLNGVATGTPTQGDSFTFVVFDSDSDGLPDAFELAYTNPPSATSMNPGDDSDNDGLINLQEYQRGTIPNNPDTDGDSLLDGTEIAGAGVRPPTNPLMADTDGDGLGDGVESNTGTWGSAANTGTNPTKTDTDADGLKDGVETNTSAFVSATNTGTNPLVGDSDGDGAGDWYEVIASYTNPNNAGSKPNIPYPLPDPDGSTGVTNKPVKVYIMSGQSNMVGIGYVTGTLPGSLETIAKRENKFPNLVNASNGWTTRNDLRYRGVVTAIGNGLLSPGLGAADNTKLGPELGFGHVMGYHHDEPVLLLKTSQGNRSLGWDILPPGSPRVNYNGNTYAGYGESPNTWPVGGSPSPFVWYAGKQYDDFFLNESDMGATGWATGKAYPSGCQVRNTGVTYLSKSAHTSAAASEPGVGASSSTYWSVYSIENVTDVLDNFAAQYPQWAAQGFEIAGFVWWQGFGDQGEPFATNYESHLTSLINSLRSYYGNRYPGKIAPKAPFVLATIGFDGWALTGAGLTVANGQLAVSDPTKHPEFAGNVKTMESRGYWRTLAESPGTQGYHYNNNAETYMLVGDALGRGMIDLLAAAAGDTTPPTLTGSAIVDNKGGGPIIANTLVSYTVTFSEDMDATTVTAADFGNLGTAVVTIGTVSETTPGVFIVPVTPTTAGTLQLRVNATAVLKDVAGNALVTTTAIFDDTTITVNNTYATWASVNAPTGTAANDFDGDGVSNGAEYVLGGTKNTNDVGKLPQISSSGNDVIVIFNRDQTSINASTTLVIEVGTNLSAWPNIYGVPDTAVANNPGVSVVKNSPPGFDTVTLTLSKTANPIGFARIKVTAP